jgi:hypothetical protein
VPDTALTARTDAGMWLLWQPQAFASVRDFESWAAELEDDPDILRHVGHGDCVPINIGQDMAAAFVVRVADATGPATLAERESAYLVVSSEPYLLVSHGAVALTGIEDVRGDGSSAQVALAEGQWAATVHLLAWDDEPGMKVDGQPSQEALPDFLVLLNPAEGSQRFRSGVTTFDSP